MVSFSVLLYFSVPRIITKLYSSVSKLRKIAGTHYVRNPHAPSQMAEACRACLQLCVSHYNDIRDVRASDYDEI
jgi:hypothetical protein